MTIHNWVLLSIFVTAMVMGAVVLKTNFCTMGSVSDWVNMGDKGRLRAWLLAIGVAILGLVLMEASGLVKWPADSALLFPPYRTANFAWLRYVLGGLLFGVGMTLGSGCANRTLVRIGGGNLKSVVVLIIAAFFAYLMLWTDLFEILFMSWIRPTIVDLAVRDINSQELADIVGGVVGMKSTATLHTVLGLAIGAGVLWFVFKSRDFRNNFDNILAGLVIGLAVLIGWYVTGGSIGVAWRDWADFADTPPSRVLVQSYTFVSPMGDSTRYLLHPTLIENINFGIMALSGVIAGSFLYAVISRKFRLEWFASFRDFFNHVIGAILIGTGGVLAMGCTIGQGVTGVSTLALGSFLAFFSFIVGSAVTMKVQYYMMDEQNFFQALGSGIRDLSTLRMTTL